MLVEGFASIVENPLETVPSDLDPYHGKIFSSHNDAYEFYMSFAKAWRRYYICHRAGHLTNKELSANQGERDRSSRRCNCGAHMSITKVMDSNMSYWHVVTFDNLHNHDNLEPQEARFLPAYRRELPFIDKDICNFVCAMNNTNRDNDAHILLTKCKQMKDRGKRLKYDFTVREGNRLEHIVWSHGSCSRAYEIFGDVVVFETTYRSNGYSMPFGIWVGVNNHGDTCLFGCAFVGLMNGKMPQTILTDQDLALKEAICKELPNTKHTFYTMSMRLIFTSYIILSPLKILKKADMHVNKFALLSNRHINNLWNLKEFWALPYLRSHFFAGMKTMGNLESINASMKRFSGSQTPLSELIDQMTVVIEMRDVVSQRHLMQQKSNNVDVQTMCPFEDHAAHVLTPYAFSKIQEEIISSFQHLTSRNDDGTYEAFSSCSLQGKFYSNSRPISAKMLNSTSLISNVSSSTSAAYVERVQTIQSLASTIGTKGARFDDCYKFIMEQFSRILEHVEEVECMRSPMVDETSNASLVTEEDENRSHCKSIHVKNHVRSITKGRPLEKRLKSHVEVAKKRRCCKVPSCGQTGHDYRNYPLRRG
ncbi:hypothetical protein AMTRI_Chr06g196910 [Amborella trichopoda]